MRFVIMLLDPSFLSINSSVSLCFNCLSVSIGSCTNINPTFIKITKTPKINEEIRLGWELKRQNSMTLLKIGIPLFFLYVLVYYTLFLGVDESGTALGYLTTAFLSSIALYFSTERPRPLSMTTIDVVFAFFYIISGISLLMIVFSQFFVDLYGLLIYPLRVILPASILGLGLFIKNRLTSKHFKPSITK